MAMTTTALAPPNVSDAHGKNFLWGIPAAVAEFTKKPHHLGLNVRTTTTTTTTTTKAPDIETTIAQLKAFRRELQDAAAASDDELFPEASENMRPDEWRAFPRPPELSLLDDAVPEEIRADLRCERERYDVAPGTSQPQPQPQPDVLGEMAIASPSTSLHSSSGASSGDSNTASAARPSSARSLRSRISSMRIGRASSASSASTASGGSASVAASNKAAAKTALHRHRIVEHAVSTAGDLVYSTYFTASLPRTGRPEIPKLASPRGEAIRKYLKSLKEQGKCASCLDDHRVKTLSTLTCQHKYCATCLRKLITIALGDEALFPPKCCLSEVPAAMINSVLTRTERALYKKKAPEYEVPWEQRRFCPRPNCGAWIPPNLAESAATPYMFRCKKCHYRMCRYCKGPMHPAGTECPEDTGLAAVMDVAQRSGWRRCYKCHAMVELVSGCRHMRCRCKAEFCYICGARWRTCKCTGTEPVHTRPQVTIDTTAVEERQEVTDAVEAADSAEAAELRRVENARQLFIQLADEQARQRRAAEEREREERRRHEVQAALDDIGERYDGLAAALTALCAEQRAKIEDRHQTLQDGLTTRWKTEMADMAFFLDVRIAEIEAAVVTSEATLHGRHAEERLDLRGRHASEEDDYWFSLQRYLKGKPDRAEREKDLMDRLRADHARELAELLSRCRQEADAAQKKLLADALGVLAEAERRRAALEKNVGKSRRAQLARTWTAERHWMDLVEVDRANSLATRRGEEEDATRARLPLDT